jgi:protoheme IX farnesyltransferase
VANIEFLAGRVRSADEEAPRRRRLVSLTRDAIALTKPRITALVLLTEAVGMTLAPGAASRSTKWLSLVGTALIVSSANALNMWWERDVDGLMSRTRTRPLPAGRLSADFALAFGLALAALSVPMLACVNLATGLLGVVALASYVLVYTPLKRRTDWALFIGAVPGAMPPLLGWCSVTGRPGLGGLLLFAFLFLWQLPHFAAIAIFRVDDYRRAGLRVVTVERGVQAARKLIAASTLPVVAASLAFVPALRAGFGYAAVAAVFGGAFVALAVRGRLATTSADVTRWAKTVFAFSIPYLAILLLVLVADRPGP